jgi:hypothetical protein
MQESLASFDAALKYNPDFFPSHRGRVDVLTAMERFDEAVTAATKVGLCCSNLRRRGPSFNAIFGQRQAMQVKPDDPGPVTDRAFALLKSRRLDEVGFGLLRVGIETGDTKLTTNAGHHRL